MKYIELFRDYIIIEKGFSKNSILSYTQELEIFFEYLNTANITAEKATTDQIRAFLKIIAEKGYKARSLAHFITVLRTFYRFLKKDSYITLNPMYIITQPKLPQTLPNVLTLEEIDSIIDSIPETSIGGKRDRLMVEILYSSGIRVSELLNITLNDINVKDGTIIITGKGNKQRIVLVDEYAILLLNDYLEYTRKLLLKDKRCSYLFISIRGNQIKRDYILKMVKKYAKIANVEKKISPHTFRHSFATKMIDNEADLRTVQTLLGHEDISTTTIYTHMSNEHLRSVYDKCHPLGKEGEKDEK